MLLESAELLPIVIPVEPKRRGKKSEWSDEKVALLRARWSDGISAADIGLEIGMTRNSVLGKVHRLELQSRQIGFTTPRPRRPKNSGGGVAQKIKLRLAREEKAPPFVKARAVRMSCQAFDAAIPRERIKSLVDRQEGECCWPIGDPRESDFGYCCAPTSGTYCPEHQYFMAEVKPERRRRA